MIYERIKELCKKNGISVNALEKEIGVSRGSLCKIDKHCPSSKTILLLASRLGSNFDYIMYGTETDNSIGAGKNDAYFEIPDKIKEYAIILSKMPSDQQEHIISLIDMLNKNNK